MSSKGWVCIHRSIQDNIFWLDRPFAKGQAWIDLILSANYEDAKEYKRGTVYTSERILSSRWGWSREKVRNFLEVLQVLKMARVKSTKKGTVITILNYEKYQNDHTTNHTTKRTTNRTTKNRIKSSKTDNCHTTNHTTKPTTDHTLITNKQINNITNNNAERAKNTAFNNFHQREYDAEFYKELERKLYNRQSGDT